MKMSETSIKSLTTRINEAHKAGKIDSETTIKAHAAIREPKRYGKTMTPSDRDSILTHRFGI